MSEYGFFFPFWFIAKDRLHFCWTVSIPCPSVGAGGGMAVMGCSGCSSGVGLPPCSWLPSVLLSIRTPLAGFVPAGNSPLYFWLGLFVCFFIFLFFLVCLPMPCVPRTKVPAGMHCSVPKAVGSCTELRRVGLGNWEEWALSRGGFYNGKSWNFKQSELKLGARGIYLTWKAPKRGDF